MCGIAGIIKWTPQAHAPWPSQPALDALQKMSEAIRHRGPDGDGMFIDPRPEVAAALLHRRLAIIDRPCGAQPMPNEDATVHVVFNGEIYNHAALRQELQAAGHVFATDHSDTEVLVHGWEQWGTDLPGKLLGMFALAIWDTRDPATKRAARSAGTLFLARDRMGQKPLFYANLEDGVVFGSTINSVLAWPEVPRRVPREQIGLYLLLGYFPGAHSVYRDVSQVLPGAWLRLRNDVLDGDIYWRKTPQAARPIETGAPTLRAAVSRAVASQCAADVPVACFLSGGIDSSIIAAEMQRTVHAAGGDRIHTVSVGFAHAAFDESPYAALVAKHIHSRHTRLEVTADSDVIPLLQHLMATSLGQPFADSSIIPTYHLSRAVREVATVALSGDGADELFAGYDRYRAMTLLARWGPFARLMPRSLPAGSLARRERYRRLGAAARAANPSQRYTRIIEIFPLELAEQLLGESILDFAPEPEEFRLRAGTSSLKLAMTRDQHEYLPGDVLWKVDSASMCTGPHSAALEVRSPFLDHRLVELANGLADGQLIHAGVGKALLRQTFQADLPPEILRRGKKGFAVPIGEWFKDQLKAALAEYLFAADSFTSRHLHKPTAEKLFDQHVAGTRDHAHRLFALLMLEIWWRSAGATLEA